MTCSPSPSGRFSVAGGMVAEIDILADPGRLGQLDLAALDG
jgi:hypothetical protein